MNGEEVIIWNLVVQAYF